MTVFVQRNVFVSLQASISIVCFCISFYEILSWDNLPVYVDWLLNLPKLLPMEQRNAIAFQNFGSHNFLGHANRKYYSTSSQLFLGFGVIEEVKLLAIMCLLKILIFRDSVFFTLCVMLDVIPEMVTTVKNFLVFF